jgi:predicted aspartyl protease
VLVEAMVDGHGPNTFVLDTGASITVISPALAARLSLATTAAEAMTGAGGTLQATIGRVASLAVGTAALPDLTVTVADFLGQLGRTVDAPLDGILGYNFLRHVRVTLDCPNQVLWLVRAT